ncbi:hypothetical protein RCL_jg9887.t1 [Rhizophagus clarus]|uniref:Uncharacterized protein n=1 Tax=Rhizophagus clarus TaxID=94130 RepID=A0A8H3QXB4_9GLOM|nr:hypothetical protein RCL_jg9887.t1 [Rhizophagus clarus]
MHIPYWNSFFQDEVTNDSINETLKNILNTLSDPFKFESNCNSQDFGLDLDTTITLHYFNPLDFYPVFRSAFEAAFNKFNAHIPSHSTRLLFQVTQIFDSKYILLGLLERKNLRQYNAIRELANPSDELLCE